MDEKLHPLHTNNETRSLDVDGTVVEHVLEPLPAGLQRTNTRNDLRLNTHQDPEQAFRRFQSPSHTREQAHRLDDELLMLQVERQVSRVNTESRRDDGTSIGRTVRRERSSQAPPDEPLDDFDVATNPLHERAQLYKPPRNPTTKFSAFVKRVHHSSFLVRYFLYISPIFLILLVPLLVGALLTRNAAVGGVNLTWFSVWLEIVWLTLWAGRILAKALPWPFGIVASLFTNDPKLWRDMAKQLELAATLFFWWLAIVISFLPTMKNHHLDGNKDARPWEVIVNKVLVFFLVGAALNFVEKIIIQLIAISFHTRTYQDRIELNRFQIDSLVKLYQYSKVQLPVEDSDFEIPSGARTPGKVFQAAQRDTRKVFNKFGDVAGKIAGDFTGKTVMQSDHPSQVVLALLRTTSGSQVLARRLYRTYTREDAENVSHEDLKNAFDSDEEAEAAFSMFDKDMNGDISMEELEAVCVEIGRERKSITASLKDLDSVVGKLDDVLTFIVVIISIVVLISIISTQSAAALTSTGSGVLALSWLFSATAQEFLQSIIFVFVKHPFDVGDRVTIYGNTGSTLKGDDYFVKEIALFYTEFKKMEGHVVQAPNSYLNTLFILNQRRSGGLAEAVPIVLKFGTSIEQIDNLRSRLLEFVKAEKREFQSNILTELREVSEVHSISLNIVFFFKSNWQNELLRLQRRNKFICALMVSIQELGIEGPRMRYPGQRESFPLYMQNLPYSAERAGQYGTPDQPDGQPVPASPIETDRSEVDRSIRTVPEEKEPGGSVGRADSHRSVSQSASQSGIVLQHRALARLRGESLSAMGRRLDFSLGMSSVSEADMPEAVEENRERERTRIPISVTSPSRSRPRQRQRNSSLGADREPGLGRSISRSSTAGPEPGLARAHTDLGRQGSSGVHRNRFFGRPSHETERMEMGMAGIHENEGAGVGMKPLDSRTGRIMPRAVRLDTNESAGSGTVGLAWPALSLGPMRSNTLSNER